MRNAQGRLFSPHDDDDDADADADSDIMENGKALATFPLHSQKPITNGTNHKSDDLRKPTRLRGGAALVRIQPLQTLCSEFNSVF